MSRRTEELHALRALRDMVLAAPAESIPESVRDAGARCASLGPRSYVPKSESVLMGGGGGCVDFGLALPGNLGNAQIIKSKALTSSESAPIESAPIGRTRWISPFASVWRKRFAASPPFGQLVKALRPLITEHGEAKVLRHWENYLLGASAQYVSAARFAATFGAWTTPDPDRWKHDPTEFRPGESIDAYIVRTSRGNGR